MAVKVPRIAPLPDRRVGRCKARYRTPQGTTATVELPGGKQTDYGPGDHEIVRRHLKGEGQ